MRPNRSITSLLFLFCCLTSGELSYYHDDAPSPPAAASAPAPPAAPPPPPAAAAAAAFFVLCSASNRAKYVALHLLSSLCGLRWRGKGVRNAKAGRGVGGAAAGCQNEEPRGTSASETGGKRLTSARPRARSCLASLLMVAKGELAWAPWSGGLTAQTTRTTTAVSAARLGSRYRRRCRRRCRRRRRRRRARRPWPWS